MNWLFDRPVAVGILGVILCVPIAIAWVMTGRKEVLYALAAAFAVFVGLLIMERAVVTDRETIEATLPVIMRDVETNNHQAVLGHIYSGSPQLKQQAQSELANFHFIECRITGRPTVEVNAQDNPRSATATFNAAAAGDFKYGGESGSFTKEGPIRRHIILKMRKEADGRWTVEDYDHESILNEVMRKKVE